MFLLIPFILAGISAYSQTTPAVPSPPQTVVPHPQEKADPPVDSGTTNPTITSVSIFQQAAAQDSSKPASGPNFVMEINGTNFPTGTNNNVHIAILPGTGTNPTVLSLGASQILAQFTAPANYELQEVALSTGTGFSSFNIGTSSCDFASQVKLTPQAVPKDQAGNKYGNGVAKNFYAIQISIVNDCPMAVVVPLAGIRVVVDPGVSTRSPLPNAVIGKLYFDALNASGGTPPYSWTESSPLPEGLGLDRRTGLISGTVSSSVKAGLYPFSVQVEDSSTPKLSATALMVLPVVAENDDSVFYPDQDASENEGANCTENGDLVAFSLDHVTSVFSADRKLTGRRAIYFNTVQAAATIGSAIEPFLAKSFTQAVAILGGGFTTASKEIFVDMSAEQLQNLTSQSFGATEQVASHGSLQKFIFVRRSTNRKCKYSLTETELRHGNFSVLWEVSPASSAAPTTQSAPAQASVKAAQASAKH
jgi:hypothetical protein